MSGLPFVYAFVSRGMVVCVGSDGVELGAAALDGA